VIKIIIETIFSLGLFFNAVLFVPQIIRLYKIKNSKSFSLATFIGFNLIQFFVILHGYLHADYLLVFGTALSLLTSGALTILIFYYKFLSKNEGEDEK